MASSAQFLRSAHRPSFDALLDRLGRSLTSLSEPALLEATHWDLGQDARLREDTRFRLTPWGRWIRAEDLLANDALYRELHRSHSGSADLSEALTGIGRHFGRRCVLCPADPRLVLSGDEVRLAASELSKHPAVEDEVGDLEKYTTHLPLHSLKAAAASEPAGEWGLGAQEQLIATLGWIRVSSQQRLNARMFVAQVEGHSMDDGRSGLVDGGYAIFELWPSGTKQLLNVLVRGAFRDPETGNYAVKKYVADQRDEEGRHRKITLVSLNHDKDRYPDIALQVEDEDALTVVAKVIQPLAPDDYARCPKPLRRAGRRELDSRDELEKVYERLATQAARFFETSPSPVVDGDQKPDTLAWNSQLVCLDRAAGGPHLELGPLFGLWSFVKRLVVRGATCESLQTLASNARLRPVRVPVLPSQGPWTWGADGFEDDPDVDLSALAVPKLAPDRLTAFRVGIDGVGRLLLGNQLSPGQCYRLLVPPALWEAADHSVAATPLTDGWYLAELALPFAPDPELLQAIERLGLRLGELTPRLSFGLPCWPDEWRSTPRGDAFAVFAANTDGMGSVVVKVDGYDAEIEGEAQLFVHGPEGPHRVALPVGTSATIELSSLSPGRYFSTLLHQRTRIQPAHLPFELSSELSAPPRASWSAKVSASAHTGAANTTVRIWRGDLARLQQEDLVIEGPPGWGVRVFWREVATDYLATIELDMGGQLDSRKLLSLTRGRCERCLLGDLVLEFAELGAIRLEHERHATVKGVREQLGELLRAKGEFVRRRGGAYAQLLPMWFEPIGQCLGYEVDALEDLPEEAPLHAAAARLLVTERHTEGIGRRCKRALVMLEALQPVLGEDLLDWIDGVCLRFGVDTALLSTGFGWAEHRRRSRLPLKVWDLEEVLGQDELLIAFLRDVAEGV